MRYKELMVEAIPHRPRNLPAYLRFRIRDLNQMIALSDQANDLVKANDSRDGEYLLKYGIKNSTDDESDAAYEAANDMYLLMHSDLGRDYMLTDLKMNLESYEKYGGDFLKYIFSTLDYVRPVDQRVKALSPFLANTEIGFGKYGYEPGNPEHESEAEYIGARKLLVACRIKAALIPKIEAMQADIRSKLSVIQRMKNHDSSLQGPHKYRPEHGPVETLYHATAFVKEIVQNSFSAEKPADRKGVGNLGSQDTISFTHDLGIARTIMRSFKELWMIAHGQLTGPQILGWARHEGILDDLRKMWGNVEGGGMPVGRDSKPSEVAKLYRYWISLSKMRENPMLVSPWEITDMMMDRSLDDIGVISCDVNIEEPNEYMWAEAEFRVPPDRVVPDTIKRVL